MAEDTKQEIQPKIQRIFIKCYECKKTYAVEYREELRGKWIYLLHDTPDGAVDHYKDPLYKQCPSCQGQRLKCIWLKHIKVVETTACDRRCTKAAGDTCNCSCGGANHGIDHKLFF